MIPKESELMSAYRVKSTFVRTTLVVGLVAGLAATLQGCVLACLRCLQQFDRITQSGRPGSEIVQYPIQRNARALEV